MRPAPPPIRRDRARVPPLPSPLPLLLLLPLVGCAAASAPVGDDDDTFDPGADDDQTPADDDSAVTPDDDTEGDDDTTSVDPDLRAYVLASDTAAAEALLLRVDEDAEVLWRLSLPERYPEQCDQGGSEPCTLFDAEVRRTWDGHDAVLTCWGTGPAHFIQEYDLAPLAGSRFRVERVAMELAPAPYTADCSEPEQVTDCELRGTHDADVLAEDAAGLDLLVADTAHSRLLRLEAERDGPDGVPVWVFGPASPGWNPVWLQPNDVEHAWDGEDLLVRVSFHSGHLAGLRVAPDGAVAVEWEHPASLALAVPHGLGSLDAGDGADSVWFAHSLALGFVEDEAGTVSRLTVGEEGPDYRYDLDLTASPAGEPLWFPRSVDLWEPGEGGELRLLIAESGCADSSDGCPNPSRLRVVEDPDPSLDSAESGASGSSGEYLLLTPPVPVFTVDCGFDLLFTAQTLRAGDLLAETLAALEPYGRCAIEP